MDVVYSVYVITVFFLFSFFSLSMQTVAQQHGSGSIFTVINLPVWMWVNWRSLCSDREWWTVKTFKSLFKVLLLEGGDLVSVNILMTVWFSSWCAMHFPVMSHHNIYRLKSMCKQHYQVESMGQKQEEIENKFYQF